MKKVVSIQDISCIGKCSLTVALPIISAMGVETAIIPTAVLSTHTAFQKGWTFRDLTADIAPICAHWKKEGFHFDALYSGYLGSFEQIDLTAQLFADFRGRDTLVLVDPAMADNGSLYPGFTKEFALHMAKLCGRADIIVPNLTEAGFLLGEPYLGSAYTEQDVRRVLKELAALGCPKPVLTGIQLEPGKEGVYAYDAKQDSWFTYSTRHLPVRYHGTGDIFASTLCGALVRGRSFEESLRIACDFVVRCIELTEAEPDHNWYGVNFEQALPDLIQRLSR
jgi:pyridoxine kinase